MLRHITVTLMSALAWLSVGHCFAQIGADPSPTVSLTGRDSRALTVTRLSTTPVSFAADPSPAGGDVFDVDVFSPDIVVSLILPNSIEITQANASSLGFGFAVLPDGSTTGSILVLPFSAPGTHTIITLPPSSTPGTYQIRLNASSVATDTPVVVEYYSSSSVRAALLTDAPLYRVGDVVVLSGLLLDGSSPITGVTASARVGDPASAAPPVEIPLSDAFDGVTGDGFYTGIYESTSPGKFAAAMRATGVSAGGVAFSRTATAAFRILTPSAIFNSFSDQGVDTNGNGLFEQLSVTAKVDVQTAGAYQFGITLAASNSAELRSTGMAALAKGAQQISVAFSAADVINLGVDGPYALKEAVLVFQDDPDKPLADSRDPVGPTAAYLLSSFEHAPIFFTGQNTFATPDTNANGKFDLLRINVGVNVATAGLYQWSGRLVDSFGKEIDFASGSANLPAGASSILFEFSGSNIGRNARNGPYFLRSVVFFGNGQSIIVTQLLETPAYSVLQFENARCPGDLNGDKRVDILDLNIVKAAFGKRCGQPGFDATADVNQDCVIDVQDLSFVSQNVGCTTP